MIIPTHCFQEDHVQGGGGLELSGHAVLGRRLESERKNVREISAKKMCPSSVQVRTNYASEDTA